MNDTISSSDILQLEFGFVDGDSRKQNIPMPLETLTENDIISLNTWIESNQVIIGDKFGASTTGINSATIIKTTKKKLDIS